ncbi:hypothetical protein GCM10010504_42170 [Streptomyces griseus]|nr:hypothetical protein GCM10010504_42170 [Streptomyces griseus]
MQHPFDDAGQQAGVQREEAAAVVFVAVGAHGRSFLAGAVGGRTLTVRAEPVRGAEVAMI